MMHRLVLDVPDDVYEALVEGAAQEEGQSPEALASQWLAEKARDNEDDPLAKWIGALEVGVVGWADDHDRYIGESLYASMHDGGTEPKSKSDD